MHEIIIRLFQYDYLDSEENKLPKESYQYFQNQLLENILSYIDNMVCEPITIEDICNKFAISRSSLQTLFKNRLRVFTRAYIKMLCKCPRKVMYRTKT